MQHPDQRVGVFIDVQNMYYSGRNLFDAKVNFSKIVERAVADRKLVRAIAYVVRTKTREEQPFIDALQKVGIETKEKEILEYAGGAKKADWDVGIAVDAIRMSEILDCVVIVSGDGDFVPLLDYLKGHGRQAEVISFRETTSTMLVDAADVYTNMSDSLDEFLISGGRPHRRTNMKQDSEVHADTQEEPSSPTPPAAPAAPTTPPTSHQQIPPTGGSQRWAL
jgi:uncharacterized LabA/DUF88 family protein